MRYQDVAALARAAMENNRERVVAMIKIIEANERGNGNLKSADAVVGALRCAPKGQALSSLNFGKTCNGIVEIEPSRKIADLVLSEQNHQLVESLIVENQRSDELKAAGLLPRHKVLLMGPPGCGKTALAGAIATVLERPFAVMSYESVVDSYMGATAAKIKGVMDYVKSAPCVLLIDEFEGIGGERDNAKGTGGEMVRVMGSLLLQIDSLPDHVMLITATNHHEMLDRAIWRRFQIQMTLLMPTEWEILRLLRMLESRMTCFGSKGLPDPAGLSAQLKDRSYAEVEDFVLGVARSRILNPSMKIEEIIENSIECLPKNGMKYRDSEEG